MSGIARGVLLWCGVISFFVVTSLVIVALHHFLDWLSLRVRTWWRRTRVGRDPGHRFALSDATVEEVTAEMERHFAEGWEMR